MLGTFLMILSAYLAGRALGKSYERKKINQEKQETATKLTEKMISEKDTRKKDLNKNAMDMMQEFLTHTSLFDDFKLIEAKQGFAKYQYLENDFLFTVIRSESMARLTIYKNKELLLHYEYNRYHSEYEKQEMNRSLIGEYPISEVKDIILRFMRYVVHDSVWETFPDDFVFKDDVATLAPIYTEEDILKKKLEKKEQVQVTDIEEPSILDNVHKMQKLVLSSKESLDLRIVTTLHSILRNMQDCLLHIDRLEGEKKHAIEHSLQKDLEKMITSYMELNEESKKEKFEETMAALLTIDKGVKEILEVFEKQNVRNLEHAVQIIKHREY